MPRLLERFELQFFKYLNTMALITCPECKKQISETVLSCPNCGFPLTSEKVAEIKEKYEREFNKSLESPILGHAEPEPKKLKTKESINDLLRKPRPISGIVVLVVFVLIMAFFYFSEKYETSDVLRYELGPNYVGNSNKTTQKVEGKNLIESFKKPNVDLKKEVPALKSQVYVKIILPGVDIKFSPSSSSKTITQAINGNIFELSEEKGDWYGIFMFSGELRYIQKSTCVKIKYDQNLPKDVQFKKMVFKSIVVAEDKAQAEADVKYPTDIYKNIDYMRILVDKYKLEVLNKYKLQPPVYQELKIEGVKENWLQ